MCVDFLDINKRLALSSLIVYDLPLWLGEFILHQKDALRIFYLF